MKLARKLHAFIKGNFQNALEYRAMLFIWMFELFFFPFMWLFIWQGIINSNPDLSSQQSPIITYYVLLPLVATITTAWHGTFIAKEIRQGDLNKQLVKPYPPILEDISNNLAEKAVKLFFTIPLVTISALFFGLKLTVTPLIGFSFMLSLILSALLSFSLETLIGYLGFWLDEVSSLENINDVLLYTLGGQVIPIFLFPQTVKYVAVIFPFRYIISFPLEILAESLTQTEITIGFLVQSVWIAILIITSLVLWQKGLRRYAAFGG